MKTPKFGTNLSENLQLNVPGNQVAKAEHFLIACWLNNNKQLTRVKRQIKTRASEQILINWKAPKFSWKELEVFAGGAFSN